LDYQNENLIPKKKDFNVVASSFFAGKVQKRIFKQESSRIPGPGSYDTVDGVRKLKGGAASQFKSRTKRMWDKPPEKLPAPGIQLITILM
jgi:hypothetical protein